MEQNDFSKPDINQLKAEVRKRFLFPGMALEFIAIVYFLIITNAENQGETKVHWLIAAVYNSMGKIGGTVLFFGLGALMVILFAVKMMGIKKMEQQK